MRAKIVLRCIVVLPDNESLESVQQRVFKAARKLGPLVGAPNVAVTNLDALCVHGRRGWCASGGADDKAPRPRR
jgi:hypothetical protein